MQKKLLPKGISDLEWPHVRVEPDCLVAVWKRDQKLDQPPDIKSGSKAPKYHEFVLTFDQDVKLMH